MLQLLPLSTCIRWATRLPRQDSRTLLRFSRHGHQYHLVFHFSNTCELKFLNGAVHLSFGIGIFTLPRSHSLAGTSGGYEERTTAMQDNPQTHSVHPTTATTIICLASASQPPSSTVYTPFDPLYGLSWPFQMPPSSLSLGQFILESSFQKFVAEVML